MVYWLFISKKLINLYFQHYSIIIYYNNMSSWTNILKSNAPKIISTNSNKIVPITKEEQNKTDNNETIEEKEYIPKKSKSLDNTKKTKIIKIRSIQNLDQRKLAQNLNANFADIKNAELGKEISLTVYDKICKYIEKHKNLIE